MAAIVARTRTFACFIRGKFHTAVHGSRALQLQLYLHTVLAFAGISLYRTRRFMSLSRAVNWPGCQRREFETRPKIAVLCTVLGDSAQGLVVGRNCLLNWTSVIRGESTRPRPRNLSRQ